MGWDTHLHFLMALTPCLVNHLEVTNQKTFSSLVLETFTAHEQWFHMAHLEVKVLDPMDHMDQDKVNSSGLLSTKGKD